jgi:O-antigen/teichoic acid export membrane protein
MFAAPLLVTRFDARLPALGAALLAVRVLGCVSYLALCLHHLPLRRTRVAVHGHAARGLLSFGGWMSVSAVLGPVMVYFDRFLIGALLSLAMVAYYTTPYDLVSRLWIVSQAVVGVLYPALTAEFARGPAGHVARLFGWGTLVVGVLVFPVTCACVLFAPEGLRLWVGPVFAVHSAPVLRWIAAGVFVNALAQVALALVQVSGHPRWSATLHVLEVPCYLAALWLLVHARGIEGAALAWFLRATVDAGALLVFADRVVDGGRRAVLGVAGAAVGALACMALGAAVGPFAGRVALFVAVLLAGAWLAHARFQVLVRTAFQALVTTREAEAP